MKDVFKAIGLLFIGLIMAIIVYPILHEIGHVVITVLTGGEVVDLSLLPLPYVSCNIGTVSDFGKVIIGFGGMLLPFAISIAIHSKNFWIWYSNFVLKGICMLSFAISMIAVICYATGHPMANEDITQVLDVWSGGIWFCFALFLYAIIVAIVITAKEHPLQRCLNYFEVPIKKANAT